MKNVISVFFANALTAAKQSGRPLPDVLGQIMAAGITALDFSHPAETDGEYFALALASGFKVNSVYRFIDFAKDGYLRQMRQTVDFAAENGAKAMFVVGLLNENEAKTLKSAKTEAEISAVMDGSPVISAAAKALREISAQAKQAGVPVCVENFDSPLSPTQRSRELSWFSRQAPELGFNLDTGNSMSCGEDILALTRENIGRTVNVHCKDRDGGCCVTPVGDGVIPMRRIVETLTANGYEGGFSIEVFDRDDTLDAILRSAVFLSA